MATGFARGAATRGKRVQFGDGVKAIWDQHSQIIFTGNPNIAPKESRFLKDDRIEWVHFYRGNRIYNRINDAGDRWIWNYDFRSIPGELFFSQDEKRFAEKQGKRYVVIEPTVPTWKKGATNKEWLPYRYQEVARRLAKAGYQVVQLVHGPGMRLDGPAIRKLHTPTFRLAAAVLSRAALYIGPEGGMHHAAAALSVPGVVLFGGFIPPQVTGYDIHTNLTGGAEACGWLRPCDHCKAAMARISVEEVIEAALEQLERRKGG